MYLVVGPGAVGLTLAGCLSKAADVCLVGRGPTSRSLRTALTGDVELSREMRLLSPADAQRQEGTVLLCSKTYDLDALVRLFQSRPQPIALCQNGLGIYERARSIAPAARFFRVLLYFGAQRYSEGAVNVVGAPRIVAAGGLEAEKAAAARFCDDVRSAGFQAETAESIAHIEWEKAMVNLITNTIASLLDAPNRSVFESGPAEDLARQVFGEAKDIAGAAGVQIRGRFADIKSKILLLGDNINSTLADIRAGRRTELDALCGSCLEIARGRGMAAPRLETLYQLLQARTGRREHT